MGLALGGGTLLIGQEKAGTDWPQYRGPNRDGISAEKGWSTNWGTDGPKVLWKKALGNGYSCFSVVGGKVYTMGSVGGKDVVYCLRADTGEEVWKHTYPSQEDWGGYKGPHSTPTVDGDRVYTVGNEGHIYCLNAADGKVVWSKEAKKDFGMPPPQWGFACSALVLDKMLILNLGPTVALEKDTGKLIWKSEAFSAGYSSAMAFKIGSDTVLASFNATGLAILKAGDGSTLGTYKWKTMYDVNAATPIIADGKVFISSGYNAGCALFDLPGGKPVLAWQNKKMRNHCNTCVLWQGYLYGVDGQVGGGGQLACLDVKTGEVKWTQKGLGTGALMLADGKLIVLGESGNLVIADASPDGYKELAKAKVLTDTCWTMPVLSGGRIFCRNHKGDMVCLDVSGK
jgi:outer membrane protein assembly factor BamB